MTALSAEGQRRLNHTKPFALHAVLTATKVWAGSAVCKETAATGVRKVASGLTAPLFMGFAVETVDNTGATGAKDALLSEEGYVEVTTITGADSLDDVGTQVYLGDDGDGWDTTAGTRVSVGKIANFRDGKFIVFYQAAHLRSV